MRDAPSSETPQCNMLVYQTAESWLMLGDSFLQQYFAEFSYNGGAGVVANNTMTLTTTEYSLPTTYIGNYSFEIVKPTVENTTVPDVTPQPEPETTLPRFTQVQKGLVYGAGGIGVLLLVLIILLSCSYKKSVKE